LNKFNGDLQVDQGMQQNVKQAGLSAFLNTIPFGNSILIGTECDILYLSPICPQDIHYLMEKSMNRARNRVLLSKIPCGNLFVMKGLPVSSD
jgi:hypothetical protein